MPKNEKEKLIKLVESGGTDKDLMILDEIEELENKLNKAVVDLQTQFQERVNEIKESAPNLNEVLKSVKGQKGDKGDKGERGERGEKGDSIKGKDGRNGKDGKDGKDGRNGLDGKDGVSGKDGKDGKDGSPDSSEDIRNKLELLEGDERLKIEAIKNLREELDELKKRKGGSFGGGGLAVKDSVMVYDLSASLDGVTKTFSLPAFWRVLNVDLSSFSNALRPTTDFTTDASAMTITFTDEIPADSSLASGQTCIVTYVSA